MNITVYIVMFYSLFDTFDSIERESAMCINSFWFVSYIKKHLLMVILNPVCFLGIRSYIMEEMV